MSSLQWFRLYHRIVDDEKIRLLAFEDRWHFVAICCLKADGLLDDPEGPLRDRKIAVKMGVQQRELDEIKRRLVEVGLIDENLVPFAWDELQFKSDTSTERVRKFREKTTVKRPKRSRNVSVTRQETESETDTEAEREEAKASSARAKSKRLPANWMPDEVFALREGLSAEQAKREADRFRDYWQAQPGQRGVKADWDATWRNWVRKSIAPAQVSSGPKYDWKSDPANRGVL